MLHKFLYATAAIAVVAIISAIVIGARNFDHAAKLQDTAELKDASASSTPVRTLASSSPTSTASIGAKSATSIRHSVEDERLRGRSSATRPTLLAWCSADDRYGSYMCFGIYADGSRRSDF